MKIPFPIKGQYEGSAFGLQPKQTSPNLKNVRPFDVAEDRMRGGQRPGLKKFSNTQVANAKPIIKMAAINTTYIEAD